MEVLGLVTQNRGEVALEEEVECEHCLAEGEPAERDERPLGGPAGGGRET